PENATDCIEEIDYAQLFGQFRKIARAHSDYQRKTDSHQKSRQKHHDETSGKAYRFGQKETRSKITRQNEESRNVLPQRQKREAGHAEKTLRQRKPAFGTLAAVDCASDQMAAHSDSEQHRRQHYSKRVDARSDRLTEHMSPSHLISERNDSGHKSE